MDKRLARGEVDLQTYQAKRAALLESSGVHDDRGGDPGMTDRRAGARRGAADHLGRHGRHQGQAGWETPQVDVRARRSSMMGGDWDDATPRERGRIPGDCWDLGRGWEGN